LQEKQISARKRLPVQKFPVRVFQSQQIGVQGLAPEAVSASLPSVLSCPALVFEVRAIDAIAEQGMADMGEVDPDLMRPPGLGWHAAARRPACRRGRQALLHRNG